MMNILACFELRNLTIAKLLPWQFAGSREESQTPIFIGVEKSPDFIRVSQFVKRPSQTPGDPHSATMFETRGLTKLKGERQFLSPLLGLLSPFPAGPNVHFAQLQVISQMPRPLDRNRKSFFVFSLIYILIIILLDTCFRLVSHSAHHSLRCLCYSPHRSRFSLFVVIRLVAAGN